MKRPSDWRQSIRAGDVGNVDLANLEFRLILKASDGRSFSLHVERYEFPKEALGPTDDNPADEFDTGRFLVVRASFCNSDGSWMASGPEMDTVELERLAD